MSRNLKQIDHQLAGATCRAVVESPSGRRSKFAYDAGIDAFLLKMILPAGMAFPLDFGFVPGTKAEDGDPVDVLILSDEAGAVGTVVEVRLIGVLEAEQTEDGKTERNDRLIAVAVESKHYEHVERLDQLGATFVDQLGQFFEQYNRLRGRGFKVLATRDGAKAAELVRRHSL